MKVPLMALAVVILTVLSESHAEAGFLKNGARPGAGDRLQTLKPPRAGSRNRIRAPGEARRTAPRSRARTEDHAWFWKQHATALQAGSPSRWQGVIEALRGRQASGRGIYSAEAVTAVQTAYRSELAVAAARHNVSEALLAAIIYVESRGRPRAVSPKGAQGLMQLIPATAKRFGVRDPFDKTQNINGGAAYLNWLLREFSGDPLLALAGYNAGEGAVRKHRGVPPFNETRDYVVKVMDAVVLLSANCPDPLVTPRSRCNHNEASG